jgi:hypothetical protein
MKYNGKKAASLSSQSPQAHLSIPNRVYRKKDNAAHSLVCLGHIFQLDTSSRPEYGSAAAVCLELPGDVRDGRRVPHPMVVSKLSTYLGQANCQYVATEDLLSEETLQEHLSKDVLDILRNQVTERAMQFSVAPDGMANRLSSAMTARGKRAAAPSLVSPESRARAKKTKQPHFEIHQSELMHQRTSSPSAPAPTASAPVARGGPHLDAAQGQLQAVLTQAQREPLQKNTRRVISVMTIVDERMDGDEQAD